MSEEILKALMELFAIISKQDTGSNERHRNFVSTFLTSQLSKNKVAEYLMLYDDILNKPDKRESKTESKLTSVKDSVKILAICRKINKTLTQKQKVVVLVRLYELVKSDNLLTPQREQIINTVSTVFKIDANESKLIECCVLQDNPYAYESSDVLLIDNNKEGIPFSENSINHFIADGLDGFIKIIRINSVNLFFLKYIGNAELFLNGLPLYKHSIYILPHGSTLRLPRGTIYYSEVISIFLKNVSETELLFNAQSITHVFSNGKIALNDINICEKSGTLVGIMGASGAGKSTLLNILSGLETPTQGSVTINDKDIFKENEELKGVIGYIAQDDLLIEELTVFQNLYYNAKLCFKNKTEDEIKEKVTQTLSNLGLLEAKDIKVGSPLHKTISGGQRKRLNIALELIREPSVLFVDEPTSGLSSRDSENVMDLLKELSQKGKLIFVVIHQPSSDIFKMFDKIYLLDVGGFPIYYGNAIESIMYLKKASHQINSDIGECETCGNVNPELLFNIIEAKEVDEYGQYTLERKMSPLNWYEMFKAKFKIEIGKAGKNLPESIFKIPNQIKQFLIFITRDVLSKISNKQYLLISLLEAPLLAFLLSFIIRYNDGNGKSEYIFRDNENIPAYIFMCVIVVLFLGLTISAEEIYKDRKILKRERFLNLSRFSYLSSKVIILLFISAIQSALFVMIGNYIVGIKGMFFAYWLMLFSVSSFANIVGLNISSAFNSAVTIYILIPLLVIPQMILGGAMFSYEKLNRAVGGGYQVPKIASAMTSRWAYEGLMVNQYVNNNFDNIFYSIEKELSAANYKLAYYIPELEKFTNEISSKEEQQSNDLKKKYDLLINELRKECITAGIKFNLTNDLKNITDIKNNITEINSTISSLKTYNSDLLNKMDNEKNNIITSLTTDSISKNKYYRIKNDFSNSYLAEITRNNQLQRKYIIEGNNIKQIVDPVFQNTKKGIASMNDPFFISTKYLFYKKIPTFYYNVIIIWLMSIIGFILLYFDALKNLISFKGLKIKSVSK
ncbi:MAG: ATP-binding cassette domain-containing protein [Bacteroidetes bacterium]|nr:ATP-binding cassette domain-containing protein [Bacteroidota bacterium]